MLRVWKDALLGRYRHAVMGRRGPHSVSAVGENPAPILLEVVGLVERYAVVVLDW